MSNNANIKKLQKPKSKKVPTDGSCKSIKAKTVSIVKSKTKNYNAVKGNYKMKNNKQIGKVIKRKPKPEANSHNEGQKTIESPVSKSALANYVINFMPSPIHGAENAADSAPIDYLPIIHKSILDIKEWNMAETAKRAEMEKRIAKIEEVQMDILDTLRCQENTALTDDDVQRIDAMLSIQEAEKLEDFEFKLFTEPIFKTKMKFRFARIGGKQPHLMVRRIYKKLVSDSVLEKYSWLGTLTKAPFDKFTNINKLVENSVRVSFPAYTEYDYEAYMGEFLRHSKSRQRIQPKKKTKNMKNSESQYEDIDENEQSHEDMNAEEIEEIVDDEEEIENEEETEDEAGDEMEDESNDEVEKEEDDEDY